MPLNPMRRVNVVIVLQHGGRCPIFRGAAAAVETTHPRRCRARSAWLIQRRIHSRMLGSFLEIRVRRAEATERSGRCASGVRERQHEGGAGNVPVVAVTQ